MARLYRQFPFVKDVFEGRVLRDIIRVIEDTVRTLPERPAVPREVAADYEVVKDDSLVIVDTSAGSKVITLPATSLELVQIGYTVTIKKKDAANTVTIQGSTIDWSASPITLTNQGAAVTLRADEGTWVIVGSVKWP
jgi:hypothetical protein